MGEDHALKQNNRNITLFRFELNQAQSIIILIFALTGLFLVPVFLVEEIVLYLVQYLIIWLPRYLSQPQFYDESYLFNMFAPNITRICIYSLFLYLSFITVKKIIGGLKHDESQKPKIIPQDRIVRWFGFKLHHGQAIFIFSLSILGIPFLILAMIGLKNPLFTVFYEQLCSIRINEDIVLYPKMLVDNAPILLNGIFFIMCLFSIFITRRGKKTQSNQLKTASNLGLLIFIGSFIMFLLYLLRLFSHLFMFTDLAYLIGTIPESTTILQFSDFLYVVIMLGVLLSLLVFSYFLKNNSTNLKKKKEPLSWFHVELTKNRFLLLLVYTIMYSCLLGYFFAVQFFTFSLMFIRSYIPGFYIIFFLLLLYSFIKINNKDALYKVLNQFNDSDNFQAKWFKFKVNRLQSVMICLISSGAMFFYIYYMITIRFYFVITDGLDLNMLFFVQLFTMLAFLSILLLFAFYTIKCTYKAVKSR